MNISGRHYRTVWLKEPDQKAIQIINQQALPFKFEILDLFTLTDVCRAVKDMYVRGAGLIGAAAAYGMYLAFLNGDDIVLAADMLKKTRPTAGNLSWAVDRMLKSCRNPEDARKEAQAIADEDAAHCKNIGLHGLEIIKSIAEKKQGQPVNILTHCNAGWLAFVDYGSALSPVYAAHDCGINVHVWADETRPRNQGAGLTAWELAQHGVSHDLIPDNAGGHLMQHGMVDMVITGADRVTGRGDAANKIGTYLKALAAKENGVPFYVAFPSSTFDFSMRDGVREIPIEERDPCEVRYVSGKAADGSVQTVQICPDETGARNWGFDVTPARFITALITERGICKAGEQGILSLYPEYFNAAGNPPAEGSVKYTAEHTAAPAIKAPNWEELNNARTKLYKLGLIGVTQDGIGFGNVSIRFNKGFLISGTATGALPELTPNEYCLVNSFDPVRSRAVTSGPVQASSESMTHGAVYEACSGAGCVMHIHSKAVFDGMIRGGYPAAPENAAYGTPEIALAVGECVKSLKSDEGCIVLAGHDQGIMVYGPTAERVLSLIEELYAKYGG